MVSSEKSQEPERLLVEDHMELDGLLQALVEALDAGDLEATFKRLDLFWARLAMHIRAEHLHLFPAILDTLTGKDAKPEEAPSSLTAAREAIESLRDDHNFFMDELARAVKTMRQLLTLPNDESAASELEEVRRNILSLKDRLELHNRLEEEAVYPLPASMLEASRLSALAARLRREVENLPPRLR